MKKHVFCAIFMTVFTSVCLLGRAGYAEEIVLRVWDRVAEMEKIVSLFNDKMQAEGKEIRAEFEAIPYDQQVPKFMSALSAGKAPDVYSLDLIQYPYFNSIGAFADITEKFETLPFKDELPQGILKLGMYKDRVYALPYEIDLSVILYNKDMFREAGLDPEKPPKTWDELIDYGKKLTVDKDGDGNPEQWGFALVGNNAGSYMFWFMPVIWGNGGSMFDDEGNVVLNSQNSVEALQFWHDLLYTHKIAPKSSAQWGSGDRYNAFISKKLAIMLGGNFNITSILTDAPDLDFGVTLIPGNKGKRATFGGGNLIGITAQCKHPDAAWEFVQFAFSKEALVEVYAPKMILIPRPSLYDNEYYQKIPQMLSFAEILGHAVTPYTFNYNKVYDPVLYYFQGTLLDKFDAKTAIEEAHNEITKLVK